MDIPAVHQDRPARDQGRQAGFTLIELLVVIVIIGILAAIAVPVFLNQRKKGYDARAKSELHNAMIAMETYYTDAQQFTNSDVAMRALDPSITWLSSYGLNTTNPPVDTVAFEQALGGSNNTVVLGVRSQSNRCFYMRIVEDTSLSPRGVSYLSGTGPCSDPYDRTYDIVNSSY